MCVPFYNYKLWKQNYFIDRIDTFSRNFNTLATSNNDRINSFFHWPLMQNSICIDLNFAVGWNRFNLSLVGIWPDPLQNPKHKSGLSRCRFMIASFFMLGFMCIPQSANLIFIWGNVDMMTENLATANIPVANSFMKAFTIWRQRKGIKDEECWNSENISYKFYILKTRF